MTPRPSRIEDYALIGDRETAALVSREGSIDWLCLPRFDSPACFASLVGTEDNGHFSLRPVGTVRATRRAYREGTLVLETEHETDNGVVRVTDCMPARDRHPRVVRVVEGRRGDVEMELEIVLRFDYGSLVPWVRRMNDGFIAIGGPNAVRVRSDVPLHNAHLRSRARFTVAKGERKSFSLAWCPSFDRLAFDPVDAPALVRSTSAWWKSWASRAVYDGPRRDAVVRSLVTLKALTHSRSGAIVAAPTTSLPEVWEGSRNWDYRYCWLRDATFTLYAMMTSGYTEEAVAWRDWLLRVVAGSPDQVKAMYGVYGERRIEEASLPWLPGFGGATPVRMGNAVHEQLQLDVFGELADTLFLAERSAVNGHEEAWPLQTKLTEYLEHAWREPDSGMWELRGPRRDWTHSKVMAWVAFDRSVKMIETMRRHGPLDRWRSIRDHIHDDVCRKGFDAERRAFVQVYGGREIDASALLIPLVGFLPVTDPRVASTVHAVEMDLLEDGFVRRFRPRTEDEGLGEGCFLPCSFWLADVYVLMGRRVEAVALFERLVGVANDVGLLAEEYDPRDRRMLGNFPQAFSHVALVNTAHNLTRRVGPARHRTSSLRASRRLRSGRSRRWV